MLKILETYTRFPSLSDLHDKENIPHNHSPSLQKPEISLNPEDSK
jgi:hypothetical protein